VAVGDELDAEFDAAAWAVAARWLALETTELADDWACEATLSALDSINISVRFWNWKIVGLAIEFGEFKLVWRPDWGWDDLLSFPEAVLATLSALDTIELASLVAELMRELARLVAELTAELAALVADSSAVLATLFALETTELAKLVADSLSLLARLSAEETTDEASSV
jgi:hypothetical protein